MQWTKREYLGIAAAGLVLGTGAIGWWAQKGTAASTTLPTSDAPLDFEIPAKGSPTPAAPTEPPITSGEVMPSPAPIAAPPVKYKVFVSGAVKVPGVYSFAPGARIDDAVRSAGGFKPNANTSLLNLADFLRDADHIDVPVKGAANVVTPPRPVIVHGGPSPIRAATRSSLPVITFVPSTPTFHAKSSKTETTVAPAAVTIASEVAPETSPETEPTPGRVLGKPEIVTSPEVQSSLPEESESTPAVKGHGTTRAASTTKFKNPGDGVINLNTATAADLEKLPGVGQSTAQKILEYRQQIGRFADVSQLQDVKGIGPKKLARILPFVSLR